MRLLQFHEGHGRWQWWSSFAASSIAVLAATCAVALMCAFSAPLPVIGPIHTAHPHHQSAVWITWSVHRHSVVAGIVAGGVLHLLAAASVVAAALALVFLYGCIRAWRKAGIDSPAFSAASIIGWAGASAVLACSVLIYLFAYRLPLICAPAVVVVDGWRLTFSPVWPIGGGLAAGIFAIGCAVRARCMGTVPFSRSKAGGKDLAHMAAAKLPRAMRWVVPTGAVASLLLVAVSTILLSVAEPDWVRDTIGGPVWSRFLAGSAFWKQAGWQTTYSTTQWLRAPLLVWAGTACALVASAGEILRLAMPYEGVCPNCRGRFVLRHGTAGAGRCAVCGAGRVSTRSAFSWLFLAAVAATGVVLLFWRRFYWNPNSKHLIWWPMLFADVFFSLLALASWRVERRRSG